MPAGELTTDALTIGEVALLQIPLWLGLLGVPLLATRMRGNGPVVDLGWWMRGRDVPIGLAIGVMCQFVLVPLVTLPVFLLTDTDRASLEAPARDLTDKATGLGVLVLVLVVVVAAPLAEEVFFRGCCSGRWPRRLPIWPAMVSRRSRSGPATSRPSSSPPSPPSASCWPTSRIARAAWA